MSYVGVTSLAILDPKNGWFGVFHRGIAALVEPYLIRMSCRKVDPAFEFISLFSAKGGHPEDCSEQHGYQDQKPEPGNEVNKIFHGQKGLNPLAMESRVSSYFSSVTSFFRWFIHVTITGTAVTRIMAATMISR